MIGIVILSILIIVFLIFGFAILFFPSPIEPTGCAVAPSFMAAPLCVWVTEKYNDNTIPTPTTSLTLQSFTYNSQISAGAVCIPTYYGYHFVRTSDGGYGPILWTSWYIQSGIENSTSNANDPVVGIAGNVVLPLALGYYMNIVRYSGTTPPDGETTPTLVGSLPIISSTIPNLGLWWQDVMVPISPAGTTCGF